MNREAYPTEGKTERREGLGYFPAVDGLRAVAVASVMIFHLNRAFLPGGFVGVDIFFVISGFVVTSSVAHLNFGSLRAFQGYFYARRLVRIYPALLITLAATCLLRAMFIPDAFLSGTMDSVGLGAYFGTSNIVLAFTDNDYFTPNSSFNPYTHTWSLGVEEQFYLFFPFLLYALQRANSSSVRRRFVAGLIGLVCIASFAVSGWLTQVAWAQAFYMLPSRFWELGIGMLLCLTIDRWRPALRASPKAAALLSAVALIATAASFLIQSASSFPFPMALLPVFAAAGLIAVVVATPDSGVSRVFGARPMVFIGKASYSLYLWHWPVYVLLRWTCGLDRWWEYGLAVGVTIAVALASYVFVETPLRRWRPVRIAPRWAIILAGLSAILLTAGASQGLLKHKYRLSLSQTKDEATWYPHNIGLVAPQPNCSVDYRENDVGSMRTETLTPKHCQAPATPGHLVVVGDSHADAYERLLWKLALNTGRQVDIYSLAGCPFLGMTAAAISDPKCRAWQGPVTARIAAEAGPGDLIFLPSLRVPRFRDQWGGPLVPTRRDETSIRDRQAIQAEAVAVVDRLSARGARVVFEGPTPVFKAPPFRCADWYDAGNPICRDGFSVSTSELEQRRAPALLAMEGVLAMRASASIWDPFPILCPHTRCDAFQSGKPIVFDGDHLSGWGDDMLFADFRSRMDALWKTPAAANGR